MNIESKPDLVDEFITSITDYEVKWGRATARMNAGDVNKQLLREAYKALENANGIAAYLEAEIRKQGGAHPLIPKLKAQRQELLQKAEKSPHDIAGNHFVQIFALIDQHDKEAFKEEPIASPNADTKDSVSSGFMTPEQKDQWINDIITLQNLCYYHNHLTEEKSPKEDIELIELYYLRDKRPPEELLAGIKPSELREKHNARLLALKLNSGGSRGNGKDDVFSYDNQIRITKDGKLWGTVWSTPYYKGQEEKEFKDSKAIAAGDIIPDFQRFLYERFEPLLNFPTIFKHKISNPFYKIATKDYRPVTLCDLWDALEFLKRGDVGSTLEAPIIKTIAERITEAAPMENAPNGAGEAEEKDIPVGMWDDLQKSFYVHREINEVEFILWVKSFDRNEKYRKTKENAKNKGRMLKETEHEKSQAKFSWEDYRKSKVWVLDRYRNADHLREKLSSGRINNHHRDKRLARALNANLNNAKGFLAQFIEEQESLRD